jgi:hypothetical protein
MNLRPLPGSFDETRDALHQIAFFAMAPARYRAVGRMGLQAAPGGFGTPRFDGRIVRVEGDTLVDERPDQVASQTITTVRAGAEFFGVEYDVDWFDGFHDPLSPVDPDVPLEVDDTAARALGQWFNFGTEVLERLRSHASAEDDVSDVTLWPEHFDPATEMGPEGEGGRASFGASPGDGSHPQPYLYVAPWGPIDRSDSYWNDQTFNGASLAFGELASSADPVEAGVAFLLDGYRILRSA